jgi:hypothetical protein
MVTLTRYDNRIGWKIKNVPERAGWAMKIGQSRSVVVGHEYGFGSDGANLPDAVMGKAGGGRHAALVRHCQSGLERIDKKQEDDDPAAHVMDL